MANWPNWPIGQFGQLAKYHGCCGAPTSTLAGCLYICRMSACLQVALCMGMLCYAMLGHAMPCHAYHAMPCHALPCHAVPWYDTPCHVMLCYACNTILVWIWYSHSCAGIAAQWWVQGCVTKKENNCVCVCVYIMTNMFSLRYPICIYIYIHWTCFYMDKRSFTYIKKKRAFRIL